MFDINDIAKTAFEPVLFTPLQRAQKDGYINITGVDGKKKIEYITSEKHVENYEDPEEKVRAEFFAELIYKYEYPANRIKVEVVVPDRLPTDRADIVVFSDNDCKRPYAIVECKKEGVTDAEFDQAIEQGVGNATWVKLRAEYVVIIAGGTRRVLDVSDKYGACAGSRFDCGHGTGIGRKILCRAFPWSSGSCLHPPGRAQPQWECPCSHRYQFSAYCRGSVPALYGQTV